MVTFSDLRENFRDLIGALEGEFARQAGAAGRTDERPRTILVGVEEGRDDGIDRRMSELERRMLESEVSTEQALARRIEEATSVHKAEVVRVEER